MIDEFHLDYPIVIDAPGPGGLRSWGVLFESYAVNAIPHAVLIDRQGKVAATGGPGEVLAKAREIAAK